MKQRSVHFVAMATVLLGLAGLATMPADARRGGSFGSRGSRTYDAPRSAFGSNHYVPPVQRSMTPRTAPASSPAYNPGPGAQPYRPAGSRFGGFGGGLIGGLLAGGFIGHFLGNGMGGGWGAGGGSGFLISLLQIALLGGIIWFVIGLFRRRRSGPGLQMRESYANMGGLAPAAANGPWGAPPQAPGDNADIALTQSDQDSFERLLTDVQDAFGREDYARLRLLTTPEIMSYLAEELSQNATQGVRNEVTGTRLIDAEVSEAWHEASGDYATIALRYENIDVMRDRTTGAIVGGSANVATETNELWTFFRDAGGIWKLSAIQER